MVSEVEIEVVIMRLMTNIINKISNILAIISSVCIIILAAMYGCDILGRLVLGTQIVGTFEIAQFLLCLITFLAFPYAQVLRSHIHVAFIVIKLPEKLKYIVSGIGFMICSVCGLLMAYALCLQGNYATGTKLSTVLKIPYAPMYYTAAILMMFFVVTLLADVIRSICAVLGNEEAKKEISRIFGN